MGLELREEEGDGGGDQRVSSVLLLTPFLCQKGMWYLRGLKTKNPQEKDPSHGVRTEVQGITVSRYVEIFPLSNLKI